MFPELIVLRHGETAWNLARRWQGDLDSPLTEKGRAQAQAMGDLLSRAGIAPDTHRAYCSPLGRARATARLALGEAWPIVEDPRLREIGVGAWAGLTMAQIEAEAGLPEDASPFDYYRVAPGGEGFAALRARVEAFLAGLDGPTVIVTHGITSRMIRTLATERDLDRFEELPGGQGVVFRVRGGVHEALTG